MHKMISIRSIYEEKSTVHTLNIVNATIISSVRYKSFCNVTPSTNKPAHDFLPSRTSSFYV